MEKKEETKQDSPKQETKKYLDRSAILTAQDDVIEDVFVEPWGGWVRVKGLSGKQRDKFEDEVVQVKKGGKVVTSHLFRAKLVALAVVDEEGNTMFSESDVRALGEKSARALSVVFNKARDLSGLTPEDVEELTEGFDEAPTDGSSSA